MSPPAPPAPAPPGPWPGFLHNPDELPTLGIWRALKTESSPAGGQPGVLEVLGLEDGRLVVVSDRPLPTGSQGVILLRLPGLSSWRGARARVAGVAGAAEDGAWQLRLEGLSRLDQDQVEAHHAAAGGLLSGRDLDFLLRAPLLAGLSLSAVRLLANGLVRRRLGEASPIMTQGEPGESLYLIQEGALTVSVEREDGRRAVLNQLGPGDVVGEMAVLTGEPRAAHVESRGPALLWELSRSRFEDLAARHPALMGFLTNLISQRLETRAVDPLREIGKYQIGAKLGAGGWSIVYQGRHRDLGLPVAIKMLKHHLAMAPEFLEAFRAEARTIARLSHRNVIRVFDIEERFRTVFIVMEWLEGESLAGRLARSGTLDPGEALGILAQAAAGLAYAHGQGVIHRDLKPENIFLTADGVAKVVDFGLACAPGAEDRRLAGTPAYMAPERLAGEAAGASADIYGLGLIAFEMLTGGLPHGELELAQGLSRRLEGDLPGPAAARPGLPPVLDQVVARALRREPDRRQADMAQVVAELEEAARTLGKGEPRPLPDATQRVTSLVVVCAQERQPEMRALLEEFSQEARRLGATVKLADWGEL